MRAYVAYWDVADGTFEHQIFLELFEDLLCQMGDRIQLNFHLSKQQHELQSHQLEWVKINMNFIICLGI